MNKLPEFSRKSINAKRCSCSSHFTQAFVVLVAKPIKKQPVSSPLANLPRTLKNPLKSMIYSLHTEAAFYLLMWRSWLIVGLVLWGWFWSIAWNDTYIEFFNRCNLSSWKVQMENGSCQLPRRARAPLHQHKRIWKTMQIEKDSICKMDLVGMHTFVL